jgi:hypothetical protein
MRNIFNDPRSGFDTETQVMLESVLDEMWAELENNKCSFDDGSGMQTRDALVQLIADFAERGVRDPQKLKALVLEWLPSYPATPPL